MTFRAYENTFIWCISIRYLARRLSSRGPNMSGDDKRRNFEKYLYFDNIKYIYGQSGNMEKWLLRLTYFADA